jgi:6-phosphofructokinase 1
MGVKINVIMGRHAGWLTAAASLARQDDSDGPHLIYVPESPVSRAKFVHDVADVYAKRGRCVVAVSEGIEDADGISWGQKVTDSAERDSHGNIQLSGSGALGDFLADIAKTDVAAKLGVKSLRVRADTFGYLQRSFAGFASPVDQAEARLAGKTAVEYAMAGATGGSVAFKRIGEGSDYGIECFRAELKDVARETKDLPPAFINDAGNGITEDYRGYAMPLVGELPKIGKL